MSSKFALALLAALCCATTPAFSQLQDWEINVNGTDYYPANGDTFATVPGLDSSAFNATTGIGSLTLTFDPAAAGSYYIGGWFFDPVGVPFYNEFGAVNGSAAAGQSWQIDIPEYDAVSSNLGSGTILDNLAAGTLNDTNSVPGSQSNYLNDCGANTPGGTPTSTCNDLVSMAMGFNFTLAANQYEVVTLNLSTTDPGGFTLADVHPVDGNNPNAAAIYYSGSATTQTNGSTAPEPSSLSFVLVAALGVLLLPAVRTRVARSFHRVD
jgi:hypothetical protein